MVENSEVWKSGVTGAAPVTEGYTTESMVTW